jgi:hypothetical protein
LSALSQEARSKAKSKAQRMARETSEITDASGYTVPGALDGDIQTGMRPLTRRAFKSGGKVLGEVLKARADRLPRKSGGRALVDDLINANVKEANSMRPGAEKQHGGMARGGVAHGADCDCAKCDGGRVAKASGGAIPDGTRPAGGRIARKGGGRTSKKGMNVNIIIAPSQPKPAMPVPGVPPGAGPLGMHQGVAPPPMAPAGAPPPMAGAPPPMMPRKSGGRVDSSGPTATLGKYPLKDGGGGGKGRREKIRAYG